MDNKPKEETDINQENQPAPPADPYWAQRIPPKLFNMACAILGGIFLVVGVVTWLLSSSAVVGIVTLGCGFIMLGIGISGMRASRE